MQILKILDLFICLNLENKSKKITTKIIHIFQLNYELNLKLKLNTAKVFRLKYIYQFSLIRGCSNIHRGNALKIYIFNPQNLQKNIK